jgi:hypothetical protein
MNTNHLLRAPNTTVARNFHGLPALARLANSNRVAAQLALVPLPDPRVQNSPLVIHVALLWTVEIFL